MPDVKRNVVGPADPATRRRLLQEALRPGPPVKPAKPAAPPEKFSRVDAEVEDAVNGPGAYRKRRAQVEELRRKN